MNERQHYSQTDIDLYTIACQVANDLYNAYGATDERYLDAELIAASLRPCHYEGPNN